MTTLLTMSSHDQLSDGTVAMNTPRSKKRATSGTSSTTSPSGQSQAFFFVDPASSTREKRAHVMRHHIQAKRKQNMLASHVDRQSRREPRVFPWMKKLSASNTNTDARPIRGAVSTKTPLTFQPSTHSDAQNGRNGAAQLPHPPTAMTNFGKGTFATSSFDTSLPWSEEQLVELWTSRLTYWSGQNEHMKKRIFQGAMRHRATFEAVVLGYCARWEYHLSPGSDDSQVRHYESRVQQALLTKCGPDGSVFDDDTLSMIFTGLALQEARFGDKEKGCKYARQAQQLQLNRQSHSVDMAGRPFLLYVLGIMDPPSLTVGPDEAARLIDYLRMASQAMKEDTDKKYLAGVPQRTTAFQFDSPLFQLLSSGPRPTQVPINCHYYVVNKERPTMEWARTAALIYIVLALCELRGQQSKVARFLDHLHRLLVDYGLDRNPACESFMYFLLEETFDADLRHPSRAWRASDLLDIHKRLPFEIQFRFNEMLLSYLMLNPPVTTVDAFERDLHAFVHGKVP